ncbi:transposase [Streptomyces sp. P17]|uniref:transposase n=1 Tax=Streptomyces sp. P17 TaxID=3074716 RepID=UPI0028F3FFE5|nr:transposase [Streptomyces sp. P17]MDT9699848.1 transposase [Streptomyces sp. P17]
MKVKAKAALNRSIPDNCPGERRRQLEYKCKLFGSELRLVPAFHTSNTCGNSNCGKVDPASRPGRGRLFICAHRGFEDDADHNAAVEIHARARRTGGSVTNSTRRRFPASSPGQSRRRMRETQPSKGKGNRGR